MEGLYHYIFIAAKFIIEVLSDLACICVFSSSLFHKSVFFPAQGDLAAVEQLLKNGADPNVKDNAGWTPLVSVESFCLSSAS